MCPKSKSQETKALSPARSPAAERLICSWAGQSPDLMASGKCLDECVEHTLDLVDLLVELIVSLRHEVSQVLRKEQMVFGLAGGTSCDTEELQAVV